MESFKKEQLNHMPTSSINFLEGLPDVVFYAVMERLPARVIENTVRQLSKNCYRRVELRRERLPRVYIDELCVHENMLRFIHGGRNEYSEKIDPAKLIQHLAYLNERVTFHTLHLDVNWDMFANCKFECEELSCFVIETTLSPERFMDVFRSVRPTRNLYIAAHGDNKIFPVTSDFFTNNYAIELKLVRLWGYGNAMVDPLNDTILLDSTPLVLSGHFRTSSGCTLNGILTMIRDWYTSERQIDAIDLRSVGGEAERQNFFYNLSGLQAVKRLLFKGSIYSMIALERANGNIIGFSVRSDGKGHIDISMLRLVPGPEADLYGLHNDVF
ncbi:unnamed protein product, partial [Mesorhabditis belari]|uniref:Uncharacterized protein n=1 Tax=Mesorhabditis belari TaxID=2138241 RepID=A0AAF3J8S4_9BILA